MGGLGFAARALESLGFRGFGFRGLGFWYFCFRLHGSCVCTAKELRLSAHCSHRAGAYDTSSQ